MRKAFLGFSVLISCLLVTSSLCFGFDMPKPIKTVQGYVYGTIDSYNDANMVFYRITTKEGHSLSLGTWADLLEAGLNSDDLNLAIDSKAEVELKGVMEVWEDESLSFQTHQMQILNKTSTASNGTPLDDMKLIHNYVVKQKKLGREYSMNRGGLSKPDILRILSNYEKLLVFRVDTVSSLSKKYGVRTYGNQIYTKALKDTRKFIAQGESVKHNSYEVNNILVRMYKERAPHSSFSGLTLKIANEALKSNLSAQDFTVIDETIQSLVQNGDVDRYHKVVVQIDDAKKVASLKSNYNPGNMKTVVNNFIYKFKNLTGSHARRTYNRQLTMEAEFKDNILSVYQKGKNSSLDRKVQTIQSHLETLKQCRAEQLLSEQIYQKVYECNSLEELRSISSTFDDVWKYGPVKLTNAPDKALDNAITVYHKIDKLIPARMNYVREAKEIVELNQMIDSLNIDEDLIDLFIVGTPFDSTKKYFSLANLVYAISTSKTFSDVRFDSSGIFSKSYNVIAKNNNTNKDETLSFVMTNYDFERGAISEDQSAKTIPSLILKSYETSKGVRELDSLQGVVAIKAMFENVLGYPRRNYSKKPTPKSAPAFQPPNG